MDILSIILIVVGLSLFEIISSIDNAIINAEVLNGMSKKARKWFLMWGILFAVFIVRGFLPFIIFWMSNPSLGVWQVFTATFSSDPNIMHAVEQSAPVLLMGGGIFLIFLFFHWIFLEPKYYGIKGEALIEKHGVWFYAIVSIVLTVIVWRSININPAMALSAVIGSTAFFITHGFKSNAEKLEKDMLEGKSNLSDISKLFYLEVIDMTFSIDGVLGAFAFTLAIPLILIGNGIGAFVVREFTIRNIERVKKYKYLKNGAMYSIFALGSIMILDSFGYEIKAWVSPVMTFLIIGYFFYLSVAELKKSEKEIKAY